MRKWILSIAVLSLVTFNNVKADDIDWGFTPKQQEKIKQLEERIKVLEGKSVVGKLPEKAVEVKKMPEPIKASAEPIKAVAGHKLFLDGAWHTAREDGTYYNDSITFSSGTVQGMQQSFRQPTILEQRPVYQKFVQTYNKCVNGNCGR